jgi:hypothetical protein
MNGAEKMTENVLTAPQFDFGAIVRALQPGTFNRDPLGLVSGFKAYHIHTALAARSDRELAALGLTRRDIPHAAMRTAKLLRRS